MLAMSPTLLAAFTVTKPVAISWDALQAQFGSDVTSRARKFRQGFADDLDHIAEVFPRVPVRLTEKGLLLSPTDPDKLFIPSVRQIKV